MQTIVWRLGDACSKGVRPLWDRDWNWGEARGTGGGEILNFEIEELKRGNSKKSKHEGKSS